MTDRTWSSERLSMQYCVKQCFISRQRSRWSSLANRCHARNKGAGASWDIFSSWSGLSSWRRGTTSSVPRQQSAMHRIIGSHCVPLS